MSVQACGESSEIVSAYRSGSLSLLGGKTIGSVEREVAKLRSAGWSIAARLGVNSWQTYSLSFLCIIHTETQ